jgi:hypothetical protein
MMLEDVNAFIERIFVIFVQVALNSDLLKQRLRQLGNLRDLETIILDLLPVLLSELARHLD